MFLKLYSCAPFSTVSVTHGPEADDPPADFPSGVSSSPRCHSAFVTQRTSSHLRILSFHIIIRVSPVQ